MSLFLLSKFVLRLLGYMGSVYKKLPNYFPKWLNNFAPLPGLYESSSCSTLLATLVIVSISLFFLFFVLPIQITSSISSSFYLLFCCLYSFFDEMFIQISCSFKKLGCFLLLSLSFLHIFVTNPLLMCFWVYFPFSGLLFLFLLECFFFQRV